MNVPVTAKRLVLWVSTSLVAFGASPIGRVISSRAVDIDGITTPARSFAPLSIGDEVTTKDAAAVVQFLDGSGVTLQPNSKLRIEGQPSKLSVRLLNGSAIYDLARTAKVSVMDSNGKTANPIPHDPLPGLKPWQGTDPSAATARYGNSAHGQSGRMPPNATMRAGSGFSSNSGVSSVQLANGITINMTASTNAVTGAITYTVASVVAPVTLPSGQTTFLTITSGPLIGDTITPSQPGSTGAGAWTFTVTNPVTGPVPDPSAVVQTTVTAGVTNAIDNNTLPSGSTAPTPSTSPSGQFSPSGS